MTTTDVATDRLDVLGAKIDRLFPKKPAKKMAYIAGLPKPKGCV